MATASDNRGLQGVGGDNEEGFGLYTAADPVNSKDYGRILVEVPVVVGAKLGILGGGRAEGLPMIRAVDEIPGISYTTLAVLSFRVGEMRSCFDPRRSWIWLRRNLTTAVMVIIFLHSTPP